MSRMKVNLAGVELKNPVMTASGTFGSGAEYSEFVDLNKLGAVVTKGVANVTDITEMAKAAEAGGADVLSLINTLTGMKIDINRRTFALANKTGGMSGPAVKPVAVRMVYQVANAVSLPIIGMGGIATCEDALEFIMAGATAVSVGTANFFNPYATEEIAEGIQAFLEKEKVEDINELIGVVK